MLITRILLLLLMGVYMAACGNRERKDTTDSSARVTDEQKFRQRLEEVNPGLRDPDTRRSPFFPDRLPCPKIRNG